MLQMEFEDVLPHAEFTVRLPQHYLYRLPQLLDQLLENHTHVRFVFWSLEIRKCTDLNTNPGPPSSCLATGGATMQIVRNVTDCGEG